MFYEPWKTVCCIFLCLRWMMLFMSLFYNKFFFTNCEDSKPNSLAYHVYISTYVSL